MFISDHEVRLGFSCFDRSGVESLERKPTQRMEFPSGFPFSRLFPYVKRLSAGRKLLISHIQSALSVFLIFFFVPFVWIFSRYRFLLKIVPQSISFQNSCDRSLKEDLPNEQLVLFFEGSLLASPLLCLHYSMDFLFVNSFYEKIFNFLLVFFVNIR